MILPTVGFPGVGFSEVGFPGVGSRRAPMAASAVRVVQSGSGSGRAGRARGTHWVIGWGGDRSQRWSSWLARLSASFHGVKATGNR
jgi:hypothetical protein